MSRWDGDSVRRLWVVPLGAAGISAVALYAALASDWWVEVVAGGALVAVGAYAIALARRSMGTRGDES